MVIFFTIFFSLVALNLAVVGYSIVSSALRKSTLGARKTLRNAARILPLDLDSPELKKAV